MTRPGHLPPDLSALAARARAGERVAPFELWGIASRESGGSRDVRQAIYRHALCHSGTTVDPETLEPYAVCPICAAPL